MTIKRTLGLLVAVLLPAGAAAAQNGGGESTPIPKGWAAVETLGFRMALPANYREFHGEKKDPEKNPHFGSWGFMSPHATRKVYVRVTNIKPGLAKDLLTQGEKHLRARAGNVKLLTMIPIPKDELGRDGAIGIYSAVMQAVSHKTKKVGEYHHLVIRGVQRYPKFKTQLSVTHMVRGDRQDKAEEFYLQHIQTVEARDPAEAKALAKKVRAEQAE